MSQVKAEGLGWIGILRLGLVQAALGSIVVLTTSTLNRVMVVELLLPAMLPGALVALHHVVQILRPRLGYGSDLGGRRTPWILGGMGVLAAGGVLAALATAWMGSEPLWGTTLAVLAFVLIGVGVGACGTSLLVLLAKRVDEGRRAAAATTVWLMMIVGFIVTATSAGHFLDPFSPERLVEVVAVVACCAFLVTLVAIRGIEGPSEPSQELTPAPGVSERTPFREALAQVWSEPQARRFTIFVFVSMLAYSAQDLILEPYAGTVFGLTPGESTRLAGVQNGGVLIGMLLLAILGSTAWGRRLGSLQTWTIRGCLGSALALLLLAVGGILGPEFPLRPAVFALGLANGLFAVAAIGSMMGLVAAGRERREGVRMGLWGAAQAIAFGVGGFIGTAAVDITRHLMGEPVHAYGTVFAAEAVLFLVSAVLAARVAWPAARTREEPKLAPEGAVAETA
ncbi:MAG: BCD family MFS transporter [Bdellovibrio bacteriovorus]